MSSIECITLFVCICILASVLGVALYYDYKLRFKREQKFLRVLEAFERYISLHNK